MNNTLTLLEEARDALELAIENIRIVTRGTSEEGRVDAYILPHLRSWIDGREVVTIESLIEKLTGSETDWTDEDFDGLETAILEWLPGLSDRRLNMIMKEIKANEDGLLDDYQPGDEELLMKIVNRYEP